MSRVQNRASYTLVKNGLRSLKYDSSSAFTEKCSDQPAQRSSGITISDLFFDYLYVFIEERADTLLDFFDTEFLRQSISLIRRERNSGLF